MNLHANLETLQAVWVIAVCITWITTLVIAFRMLQLRYRRQERGHWNTLCTLALQDAMRGKHHVSIAPDEIHINPK